MLRSYAVAAALLGFIATVPAVHAGIADSPLPVLQAGVTTLHLYSVPGVINDAGKSLSTFFSCTSASTSSMVVGVELFPAAGGGPVNNATTTAFTLGAGATVIFGTSGAIGLGVDVDLAAGALAKGSARILSTSKHLICTAFIADPGTNPPASMVELTIVAKVKQKAAN